MDVILVGPGRAGMSIALRCVAAGHSVTGVLARDSGSAGEAAHRLGTRSLAWDEDLPATDLLLVAVRDDAIEEVASRLAGRISGVGGVVHLSGLKPVSALAACGVGAIGSFHPLQTMPTPEIGQIRLEGAWVAVTSDDNLLADELFALATSLGMHPFELDDSAKPLYHAAAAAAANYSVTALAIAEQLFAAAGVPFAAAGPLVSAVVANAMELGPRGALTGPIARGDLGTVRSQIEAVAAQAPELLDDFKAFARATARLAGTAAGLAEVLR